MSETRGIRPSQDPGYSIPAPEAAVVPQAQVVPPSAIVPQAAVRSAPTPATPAPAPELVPSRAIDIVEKDGAMLWLRKWNLSVGTAAGDKAIDLSKLAFDFAIEKSLNSTPYTAVITIYNIDFDIVTKMEKELTIIHLDAGYQPPSTQYGTLFHGPIVYYKYGRKNATDTFVEIHALQQDTELNRATINTKLDAGHTQEDVVKACVATMTGITLGQIPPELTQALATRARTLFGMARDVLRDVARTIKANVFIDDNKKLHIIKDGEALREGWESVPVLGPKTGMIDVPEQVLGAGVNVRSLLNPALGPGHQIKVALKDITKIQASSAIGSTPAVETARQIEMGAKLSDTGIYVIGTIRHSGMNRGDPWFTDVSTKPLDPTKPGSGAPSLVTQV